MSDSFSIKKYIGLAWTIFKSSWKTYYKITIIVGLLLAIVTIIFNMVSLSAISTSGGDQSASASLIKNSLGIVNSLLMNYFAIGLTLAVLMIVRGQTPTFNVFKVTIRQFINVLVVNLLYGIIILVGYILLIVPGVIWSLKYTYASTLVIDLKMRPLEALKASSTLTNGIKWRLFLISYVYVGILILGFLALGVGLLVASPIVYISTYLVYDSLLTKLVIKPTTPTVTTK